MSNKLYIVVPCYNEREVLGESAARLLEKLGELKASEMAADDSRILFVDDGSSDNTWNLIESLHQAHPTAISGLKLSCNKGHQNALLAGLMAAKDRADVVVSMDADLQDDIDAVDEMLKKYREGNDIVYGVRSDRVSDTPFKRFTAQSFYRLMGKLGVNIVFNHADYRLMSRRALEGLADFREVNLFLRGIVPLIGFKTATVPYHRGKRFAGQSKYPLRKMLQFAMEGITSFSVKPIRLITLMGMAIFIISMLYMAYSVTMHFLGRTYPGWSSLFVSIWMLGGLQLLGIGVIGEYIARIYEEVKARPKYIIDIFLDEQKPM